MHSKRFLVAKLTGFLTVRILWFFATAEGILEAMSHSHARLANLKCESQSAPRRKIRFVERDRKKYLKRSVAGSRNYAVCWCWFSYS